MLELNLSVSNLLHLMILLRKLQVCIHSCAHSSAHSQTITRKQAFNQDLKSGRPKCVIGPAQRNNL